MSYILLLIWQVFFVLQVLDWPRFGLQVEQPVTAILIGSAFIVFLFEKKLKNFGAEFWLLSAFVATIIVSGFANGWLGGGVAEAQIFVLTAFLPFILFSNHGVSIKKQHFFMFLLLGYSLLMVNNGLAQRSSADGMGWTGTRLIQNTRITFIGLLDDPNDLGQYFVMCIPFAAYFMRHGSSVFTRLAAFVVLLNLCFGIYLTDSRGTLLGALGILAVYIYYRYGMKKAVLAALPLLPIVAYVTAQFRAIELEESAMERADSWYTGMQLFEQNPLLGVSMGSFTDYSALTAHNSFVLVMSELGLIGYILWLSIIIISLVSTVSIAYHYRQRLLDNGFKRLEPTELNRALALNSAILFSLLGYLFCAFFLSRSYSAFLFMLCAFCSASYARVTMLDPELRLKQPEKLFRYTMAGSFGSIVGMYAIVRVLLA